MSFMQSEGTDFANLSRRSRFWLDARIAVGYSAFQASFIQGVEGNVIGVDEKFLMSNLMKNEVLADDEIG